MDGRGVVSCWGAEAMLPPDLGTGSDANELAAVEAHLRRILE
jgi:hypothetical protein